MQSSGRSRAKPWIGQEISICSRGPFGICWFYFNRLFKNCNLDTRLKQFIIIHLPHKHANLALACQEGVAVRIAGGVVHLAHADRPITQVIAALLVNISDKSSDDNFDPSIFLCLSMKMMMPGISAFGDSFDNPLPPTTNFAFGKDTFFKQEGIGIVFHRFGFPMQFVIYMTVRYEICIVFLLKTLQNLFFAKLQLCCFPWNSAARSPLHLCAIALAGHPVPDLRHVWKLGKK